MDNIIRLDKFLSSQLSISRTDAKKAIAANKIVLSSGKPARPETKVDTALERVYFEDKEIAYKKHLYIAQNKPSGVVSASRDNCVTVIDILPDDLKRGGLFPAGRLDKDTTGFVLITDDGEFAHSILSPASHVEKTYVVTLKRNVSEEEKKSMETGLILDGEKLAPAKLNKISDRTYEIILTQGIYHQIKRMFAHFDNSVLTLHRTKIGRLFLPPELSPGESRELTAEEKELIK